MRSTPIRLLAISLSIAALLGGCGSDDEGGGDGGGETSTETTAQTSPGGCREVGPAESRQTQLPPPPEQAVTPGERLTAVVETSCGTFKIALDTERAPKTVNSFVYLSEQGFYDGLAFHRIATDFVIQGGDPLGNGTGGPGYSVDETPPSNLAYTRGIVAMAKSEVEPPGRSGSQFFVTLPGDLGLPPDYALIGKVSEGIDVVDRIGALGNPDQSASRTVLIDAITIEEG